MNRIDAKFSALRASQKKALITFITAGDPSLEDTAKLVLSMEQAGADIIELGVPFSDPMADGKTIQEASFRSLQNGTTLKKILQTVSQVRTQSQVPIALMTYYNPILHFGEEKFIKQAKAAGVDGLIIPDLPVSEAESLRKAAVKEEISLVFFLAPTTSPARMKEIVKAASGFIYFVSVAGVTGARTSAPVSIERQVKAAQKLTPVPVCVGFGISTPQQARQVAAFADGVIVGSAIVKEVEKNAGSPDMPEKVAGFVREFAAAL